MKEQKKTYVGAAVFFERLADDGWPEDTGLWPFDEWTSPANSHERVRGVRRLSRLIESYFRSCTSRRLRSGKAKAHLPAVGE
jgi:hypothetical protein